MHSTEFRGAVLFWLQRYFIENTTSSQARLTKCNEIINALQEMISSSQESDQFINQCVIDYLKNQFSSLTQISQQQRRDLGTLEHRINWAQEFTRNVYKIYQEHQFLDVNCVRQDVLSGSLLEYQYRTIMKLAIDYLVLREFRSIQSKPELTHGLYRTYSCLYNMFGASMAYGVEETAMAKLEAYREFLSLLMCIRQAFNQGSDYNSWRKKINIITNGQMSLNSALYAARSYGHGTGVAEHFLKLISEAAQDFHPGIEEPVTIMHKYCIKSLALRSDMPLDEVHPLNDPQQDSKAVGGPVSLS